VKVAEFSKQTDQPEVQQTAQLQHHQGSFDAGGDMIMQQPESRGKGIRTREMSDDEDDEDSEVGNCFYI
jgi:hypothetical protein